ncbi:MAG: hypothetical protein OXG16_10880 [Rhodospirillales bacterium]|nr:hypothetical protein [Rhodospirillales bacterium]MDE0712578.1 hypothetical protein [Rhodospirillales bacterium]
MQPRVSPQPFPGDTRAQAKTWEEHFKFDAVLDSPSVMVRQFAAAANLGFPATPRRCKYVEDRFPNQQQAD